MVRRRRTFRQEVTYKSLFRILFPLQLLRWMFLSASYQNMQCYLALVLALT